MESLFDGSQSCAAYTTDPLYSEGDYIVSGHLSEQDLEEIRQLTPYYSEESDDGTVHYYYILSGEFRDGVLVVAGESYSMSAPIDLDPRYDNLFVVYYGDPGGSLVCR